MKGRAQKTRTKTLGKSNGTATDKKSLSVCEPVSQDTADASVSDLPPEQTTDMSPLRTPRRTQRHKRQAQEAHLTSTPVRKASRDVVTDRSPSLKQKTPEYNGRITRRMALAETSQECVRVSRARCKRGHAFLPRKVKGRMSQDQKKTSSKKSRPPSKCRCTREHKTDSDISSNYITSQAPERTRPRFELHEQSSAEHGESLMSSDLSIELSPYEEKLPSLSQQEEEEEESEEEEELPSFLQVDKKPPSITQGAFVWYRMRTFPYWPALVKRLNHKQKKANIIFIDNSISEKKKGFAVPLRSLRPFDCEEADEMIKKGKEYASAFSWVLDLINDYRIRIACGSFTGSFIEYFVHDISHPVRRTYPQEATGSLALAREAILLENVADGDSEDEIPTEQEEEEEDTRKSKRLLPDRTHAAHNRANEKLVHFIVKQRMVEERLLAVIHGQQRSRWLHDYHTSNRQRIINAYLEDSKQLDSVYFYLSDLHAKAVPAASSVDKVLPLERVTFVLDVLLPEAITYAIAGVDNVSVEKAEEKYLKGRQLSERERQEHNTKIERLWMKSQFRTATAHSLSSSLVNESKDVLL